MALRITTLETGTSTAPRTREEWRALVDSTLSDAAAAISAGRIEELPRFFAATADWTDGQRAYQARRQLVELVFSLSGRLAVDEWTRLYAVTAEALLDVLEAEPREPVLLNYAGVLLYELLEPAGAETLFKAAKRLDPELLHVDKNLAAARERKRARSQARLDPRLAARVRGLGARARRLTALARPVNGLTLSLCMIVKDEEEMLPGCLAAVRDAVDEIVVVDTGSSDRTVEIAESFGAKVVHFPWNGSFADARNESIRHATGDWIMYLDADEHLVPEDGQALRALLGRTWREAFYLVETNYTGGEESGAAVTHMALRVWRRRPEYRFEGRIHEQKTQSMPTYLPERFESSTVRVMHYGYLKSRIASKDKSRRNIELLEREAAETPSPFTSFNLGSEYLILDEPAAARGYLDDAWTQLREDEAWETTGYAPLLVARVVMARRLAGDVAAALAAIDDGLQVYPSHTDLVFEAALASRALGRLDEAVERAERCLAMGDAPARYAATVGSGTYLALNLIAELAAARGRDDEAEAYYRRSLAEHPQYLAPVLPLATALLARGVAPEDVRAELPLEKPSALLLAATAAYEAGHAEAAEAWFRTVLERQPANAVARIGLVEALLTQRRYDEAAVEAGTEPADSPLAATAAAARLFACAAAGDADGLAEALAAAEAAGVAGHDLDLYRAWRARLAGEAAPVWLPAEAGLAAVVALEALLRVQDVEAFASLLPVWNAIAVDEREKREAMARLYLRRGFLESAADEWIAVVETSPDARALVGLAQVALAQALPEDARAFAEEALAIDPASREARVLCEAIAA